MLIAHQYNNNFFTCFQCGREWIPILKQMSHMSQHMQVHKERFHRKYDWNAKKNIKLPKENEVEMDECEMQTNFDEFTLAEFHQKQNDFIQYGRRGSLHSRVAHIRTIQNMRNKHNEENVTVSILKSVFDKEDEILQEQHRERRKTSVASIFNC